MTGETTAGHYCGQEQPHAAHDWQTPPAYGTATLISTYQCAGKSDADYHDLRCRLAAAEIKLRAARMALAACEDVRAARREAGDS